MLSQSNIGIDYWNNYLYYSIPEFCSKGGTEDYHRHPIAYTGKMSTCVKHMFKTKYVEHMFNMCETYVKIHICLTCIFFICLTHV